MERVLGGRYRCDQLLGSGATGQVFAGVNAEGHPVAVKLLRNDLIADPSLAARLPQERAILVGLRHSNLVGVHDLVTEGETVAIVTDLINGPDLRRVLTEIGPLLPAEVARIGSGVAAALAELHRAGLVHGDVKPENILIEQASAQPRPRLTDFGVFRLVGLSETGRSLLLARTLQYAAPELADGAHPSPAADLYSLGVVLYELCCGVTPFSGGSMLMVIRHHAELEPGRPDGIPPPLWDVISWLLAKKVHDRPQAAKEVADRLGALATQLHGVPVAPRLNAPPPGVPIAHGQPTRGVAGWSGGGAGADSAAPLDRPAYRRRRIVLALVATFLLLSAVAGWAFVRTSARAPAAAPATSTPAATQVTQAAGTPAPVGQPSTTALAATTTPDATTDQPSPPTGLAKVHSRIPFTIPRPRSVYTWVDLDIPQADAEDGDIDYYDGIGVEANDGLMGKASATEPASADACAELSRTRAVTTVSLEDLEPGNTAFCVVTDRDNVAWLRFLRTSGNADFPDLEFELTLWKQPAS